VFQALATLEDEHRPDDVCLLQYGDSHTASDTGTSVVRRTLQARFGDGGRGFVAIGRPWQSYIQDGVRGGMTGEFDAAKMRAKDGRFFGDGCYGLLGIGIGASAPGARAWTKVSPPSSRVEVAYWQDPHAGSFDLFIDGAKIARVTARAPQAGAGFSTFDVPETEHRIEVRTVGDGGVRVFGMALDRAAGGVEVDALGINGAEIFTPLRWNEAEFAEQLRHRKPSLFILAYGTNEALEPDLTDSQFEKGLVDLIGRFDRAVPGAACLVLGPPDAARCQGEHGWSPLARVVEISAIEQRVAEAAGCAFYDQIAAMGGPGSMLEWATEREPRGRPDRIHLTMAGYSALASSFSTDLLHAYDEWRASEGLPPTTASKTWGVAAR
jgi:lysophospholipase L1-like esterase